MLCEVGLGLHSDFDALDATPSEPAGGMLPGLHVKPNTAET